MVCYVKVILTNQKYALIIFSAKLITLRGICIYINSQARPLIGWRNTKQKNTLAQHFWTLLVTRVVRARSYETIQLIGTHCVRTYSVYS